MCAFYRFIECCHQDNNLCMHAFYHNQDPKLSRSFKRQKTFYKRKRNRTTY